ncbi:Carnitine O-acetyltransferase [Toxocara canis]|uniref:Carnitine O-acetyltransferase n=1 Tax=Toxocara canis TaxID=6265 RepID=A0A0B2UXH6_TOXCA|nr:Carnitine O-acetyltransferase [Toxocara canis]
MRSREADILQSYLEDRAVKMNNWLTPWWIDKAYLEARTPLPIVTNPGVSFPMWNYSGIDGQIETAAKVAQSALKFYLIIMNDELPQERVGDVYLDMKQYKYLFGTTRIPALLKDKILYGNQYQPLPKHFVVMRNGHLFRVPAFDSNGRLLSVKQLENELKQYVMPTSGDICKCPVGVVTSEYRDKWADLYARLKEGSKELSRKEVGMLFMFDVYEKGDLEAVVCSTLRGITQMVELFRVPAFDSNGRLLSVKQLENELKQYVMPTSGDICKCPVGVVTSEYRDKWADLYARLKDTNAESVRCVEEALFVLCIDKPMEGIPGASALDLQSLQCLHGGGCENNSHNRWFDKTLQFIIGTDGYCGINYEHTPIEGPPVATLMEFICVQL